MVLLSVSAAHSSELNYQCIADHLQAYNSDIYYNLSKEEIDKMLGDEGVYGHDIAVYMAERCEAQ